MLVISATENTILHAKYLLCGSVQFISVAQSCSTLCNLMDYSMPGFPVHHQLPELNQTHVHWVDDAIQLSHPVIPFSSHHQSFPASWSFPMSQFFPSSNWSIGNFSINPSNDYSGLVSLRIDWFELAVQETLKSLLQQPSSKASIRENKMVEE